MKNCPHTGVAGVVQPTRSVVASISPISSFGRGQQMPIFCTIESREQLVLAEV